MNEFVDAVAGGLFTGIFVLAAGRLFAPLVVNITSDVFPCVRITIVSLLDIVDGETPDDVKLSCLDDETDNDELGKDEEGETGIDVVVDAGLKKKVLRC